MPKKISEKGKKVASNKKAWQAHLKAWEKSGCLSGKEYCRQRGLSYYAFAYWKKKLGNGQSSALELVPVLNAFPRGDTDSTLKIEVGSRYKIEVPDGFTPRTLAGIIVTLEGCR